MTRRLVVLKSPAFADADAPLPYRIDYLRAAGWDLVWNDRRAHLSGRWARWVGRSEALLTPWLQTWHLRRQIREAPATLAFFESEGHGLALARSVGFARRGALVVMSCWLADIAPGLGPVRRTLYRQLYRRVDAVTVFSANQVAILHSVLGIPASRVHVVPFGIDVDEVRQHQRRHDGYVLAVGRDAARDWETLFAAVRGTGRRVVVLARPSRLPGPPPAEVEFRGYVDREAYLNLLAGAVALVVITREAAYPSGQTVLSEALALGVPALVTATAAMRSFAADLPVQWVPVGDPTAVRSALDEADHWPVPDVPRDRLDARAMWRAVAEVLDEVTR